jgi:hypothetical protein
VIIRMGHLANSQYVLHQHVEEGENPSNYGVAALVCGWGTVWVSQLGGRW